MFDLAVGKVRIYTNDPALFLGSIDGNPWQTLISDFSLSAKLSQLGPQ